MSGKVIGIALIFAGYGIALTGAIWLRGYNLTLTQMWSPTSYFNQQWPPGLIPDGVLLPGAASGAGAHLGQAAQDAVNAAQNLAGTSGG